MFLVLEDITQEINIAIYGLMKGSKTKHDIQVTLRNAGKVYGNDNMYKLSDLLNRHGDNLKNVSRVMNEIIKEPSAKRIKELLEEEQLLAGEYPKAHKTIASIRYEEFMEVVYEGMGQDD